MPNILQAFTDRQFLADLAGNAGGLLGGNPDKVSKLAYYLLGGEFNNAKNQALSNANEVADNTLRGLLSNNPRDRAELAAMMVGSIGNVSPKTYYRRTHSKSPMSRSGYAMFSEKEPPEMYGPNQWVTDENGAVSSHDLEEDFRKALENSPEFLDQFSGDDVISSLVSELSPDNIINSAGAWDNEDIVDFLYQNILEPKGITTIRTPDGLITFDGERIKPFLNK